MKREVRPVQVEAKRAGFGQRLAAWLVDGFVVGVLGGFVVTMLVYAGVVHPQHGNLLLTALACCYLWLYTGLTGKTPGKRILKIRVVGPGGGPPGLGRAFVREVLGKMVSGLVFGLGYLWMLWDREKRCWHDRLAGTFVVAKE